MTRGLGVKTIEIRKEIKKILNAIQPASVRAVCYKLFVGGFIPNMSKSNTNGISGQLVTLREDGTVPWAHMVDESREIERHECWNNFGHHFDEFCDEHARDHWQDQPERVIIASEKGTVRGTLQPVLAELKVPLLVGHGYNSATLAHDLSQISRRHDRPLWIIYVGDHDPSGMHMSEVDLPERLTRYGGKFKIVRIAVTTSEVPHLSPFSANDNLKNSNRPWYLRHYGDQCAELDAVDPPTLRARVRAAVLAHIDGDAWARGLDIQAEELARLAACRDRIIDLLEG